jgi:hypothetical protein
MHLFLCEYNLSSRKTEVEEREARSLYIFLIEKNIAAEILNAGTLVQSCGSMVY